MCISALTPLSASLFVDTPLVSVDFDGQVVLEWVAGPRRLSVFATDEAITYVKSWGTNIQRHGGRRTGVRRGAPRSPPVARRMSSGDVVELVDEDKLYRYFRSTPSRFR